MGGRRHPIQMSYLAKNLVYFLGPEEKSATQAACAQAIGLGQSAISKIKSGKTKESGYLTVMKLADYFNVSMDDLVRRDIAQVGVSPKSQPGKLDPVRMGLALTSFDKSLKDMEIQGRLGTLVEPLQFAYSKAFLVRDPDSQEDRQLFDELVKSHLRGWKDGRRGVAGEGAGEDRKAKAQRAQAGHRRP